MKLTPEEISSKLSAFPKWSVVEGKLHRQFIFKDFKEAFRFMTNVAAAAEVLQHHPEWKNEYNTVDIFLSTHDAGGITEKDFELATEIEKLT